MSLSAVAGARVAGLLAGLCLVGLVALGAWRVPASPRPAQSEAALRAISTGSVAVVVRDGGAVDLRNQTAGPVSVRARVAGGEPELDRKVAVVLRIAGRVAYRGSLERLRAAGVVVARLPRGGSAAVVARATVPVGVDADRFTLTFEGAR